MSEKTPSCCGYDQILALAKKKFESGSRPRAILAAYASPLTLQALERAYLEELVDPVIVGDIPVFEKAIAEHAPGLDSVEIIDEDHPVDSIRIVVDMVAGGEADLVVHGGILSARLIRDLLEGDARLMHPGKIVSHVAVAESSRYKKVLLISDGVVHDQPDLSTKLGIIQNLIGLAGRIGVSKPKIGVLAAVEVVYPQMPVTMEAAVLAKMSDREQIKGAYVDGPISVDVALDPVAAHSKGVNRSDVAGDADAFIAPNAATAHGMYEALQFLGECKIGGVVLGARVPMALSFPSDTVETRFHSILLAVMAAELHTS